MRKRRIDCRVVARACVFCNGAAAAGSADTPEIEQVRDISWEPKRCVAVGVQSARTRLVKLEQVRSDPKVKDRQQTHDLPDDFQRLHDDLNDNVDTYVDRHDDIRKPLKPSSTQTPSFSCRCAHSKTLPMCLTETAQYEFVLTNAIETVDSATDDHRKLLG